MIIVMKSAPADRRPAVAFVALGAVLVIAVVAVYWPALSFGFLSFDDNEFVYDNPLVTGGLTPGAVWAALREPHASLWIPLTWLSFMIDATLFGSNPGMFHLTNVILHAFNAALLFLVLWRLTGKRWPSLLAAALFALHPLRVESVAWVTERKDVLSTAFFLTALLAYGAWVRRSGLARYFAAWCCVALGMMAKPMLVSVPFVLLALDFWPLGRWVGSSENSHRWRVQTVLRLVLEKVPFAALSVVFSAITLATQGDTVVPLGALPLLPRLEAAASSYFVYLRKLFWPHDLALVTTGVLPPLDPARFGLAVLGLVVVTAVCMFGARRAPWATSGWLWYLGTLLPVSGVLPAGAHTLSDRFTYIPHIGVAIALVWGAARFLRGRVGARIPAAITALFLVAALALESRAQLWHWRDTNALFSRALAVSPADQIANTIIGVRLLNRGDATGASQHLRRALQSTPLDGYVHGRLGLALGQLDDIEGAITHLGRAVELDPANAEARFNLGVAFTLAGRAREAEREYRVAARLQPEDQQVRLNLALLLLDAGRPREARVMLEELDSRGQTPATILQQIGVCWEREGDAVRAGEYYERARNADRGTAGVGRPGKSGP